MRYNGIIVIYGSPALMIHGLSVFRDPLVLLEQPVLLDFRDSLVCLVLEEIVVHLVVLVLW